jgi:uncharacterized repeat protein (TIGR01451 family)
VNRLLMPAAIPRGDFGGALPLGSIAHANECSVETLTAMKCLEPVIMMSSTQSRMPRQSVRTFVNLASLVVVIAPIGCSSGIRPIKLSTYAKTTRAEPIAQPQAVGRPAGAANPQTQADAVGTGGGNRQLVQPVAYEEQFTDQPAKNSSASVTIGDQTAPDQLAMRPRIGSAGLHSSHPSHAASGECLAPGCQPGNGGEGFGAHLGGPFGGDNCSPGVAGYAPMPAFIPNPQGIEPNEFLCNGGDEPPSARARVGDQIIGVGIEDTVARYTTQRGEVNVTASNRVCLYAPRFGSVRRVTGADVGELAVGTRGMLHRDGPVRVSMDQPGLAVTGRDTPIRDHVVRGPDAVRARDRGVPVENVLQPYMAEEVLALLANLSIINRGVLIKDDLALIAIGSQAATIWTVDQEVVVAVAGEVAATVTRDQAAQELVVYELPDAGRLRICKVADRGDALPGEIVTFILRIDNVGDSPLREIVLTDSLTNRLQYVPESQTSSREAEFSVSENDGQALRLTWKFPGELKVGEGATVEFKCKVR